MSKLSRVIQRVFGETGGTGEFGVFGSSAATPPGTNSKDLTTIQSLSQYLQGWFSATANAAEPPRIEDRNSLDYLWSAQLAYLMQNGVPEWLNDPDQLYYADVSYVSYAGDLYLAILGDDATNLNTQKQPDIEPTWWKPVVLKAGGPFYQPIGAIYIQLKGESDPSTLGLEGTWSNVSSSFAGQFFRAEGGNAATFGSSQVDAMQRITGAIVSVDGNGATGTGVFTRTNGAAVQGSGGGLSNRFDFDSATSISPNPAKTDDVETRPTNDTVRIWKRTA